MVAVETDVCVLCGTPDQDKESDHLREVYWMKNLERFDASLFVPRLTYDEKYYLKSGFSSICSNRSLCRKRQKSK